MEGSSGQFSNNSTLIGNLDPGGYFTLDATLIPAMPGSNSLLITIDYTNDFNQSQVITQSLVIDVIDQQIIEPPIDVSPNNGSDLPSQVPESFLHMVWRFILGLVGLDSGLISTQSSDTNMPIETTSPEQPIIVPAKPPLKGP